MKTGLHMKEKVIFAAVLTALCNYSMAVEETPFSGTGFTTSTKSYSSSSDYGKKADGTAEDSIYKGAESGPNGYQISQDCTSAFNMASPLTMSKECAEQQSSLSGMGMNLIGDIVGGMVAGVAGGIGELGTTTSEACADGCFDDEVGAGTATLGESLDGWASKTGTAVSSWADSAATSAGNYVSNYWDQNGQKLITAAGSAAGAYVGAQASQLCDGCGVLGASIGAELGRATAGSAYTAYQTNASIDSYNQMIAAGVASGSIPASEARYLNNISMLDVNSGFSANNVAWSAGTATIAKAAGADTNTVGLIAAGGNFIGQATTGTNAGTTSALNQLSYQTAKTAIGAGASYVEDPLAARAYRTAAGSALSTSNFYGGTGTYGYQQPYQQVQSTQPSYTLPLTYQTSGNTTAYQQSQQFYNPNYVMAGTAQPVYTATSGYQTTTASALASNQDSFYKALYSAPSTTAVRTTTSASASYVPLPERYVPLTSDPVIFPDP